VVFLRSGGQTSTSITQTQTELQMTTVTADKVLHYTQTLCEVLRTNYQSYRIDSHRKYIEKGENVEWHEEQIDKLCLGEGVPEFSINTLRKYHKIIMKDYNQSHVHLFVDKETGDVYKPASFKSPAKGVRYNLIDDTSREEMYKRADFAGSYLYAR
jgi:hypothetical protein